MGKTPSSATIQGSRTAEDRLRLVIDSAPALIHTARPDGYLDFFNQSWLKYVGRSLEDVQGWKWTTSIHPDDVEGIVEKWRASLTSGEPFLYEARVRRADGEYRWMLHHKIARRDEQGKIVKWYGSSIDIEARIRAEGGLRAAISERTRLAAVRAEIGMTLARKDTLRETLRACAEALVRHLDAAFARIWTLNTDGQELELQASAGMYTRLNGSYSRIPLGELKIGFIAQERKAHLTNDVQNDPRISDHDWARAEKITSFAGYPLLVENRVAGVMGMFSRSPLTESTLDTLAFVADGIAQGVERKHAEEKLRRSEAYLAEAQKLNKPCGGWCGMRLGAFAASSGRRAFPVMVCILFSACHPQQENAGPLIEFTKVPRAGEGNPYKVSIIEGRVLGARPGQQIVLFARSGAWWVQPLADQPYTKIQPDSTWRNSTHPGMQYAALLVDPGYHPPALIIVLPSAGGGVAALATVEGEPFFWQTWWFRFSAGLALLAVAFGTYSFRVRNIEERERQFRRLAENAPDIVMRLDPDFRYTYVNPIVEEYTGLPPGALVGKTNQEVGMFEKNLHSWEAGLRQVFSTGQATIKEFTFNTPRGERHFESRLVPELGADGSTKSVLAVTRDITDRKRAEDALRASEQGFRLIVDSIPGLVNTTTAAGEIDLANQQLLDYVGKTLEELNDWRPLVHPDDLALAEARWSRSVETGHPYDDEHRLRGADDVYRWFHLRGHPLRDKEGQIVRWYILLTDIDERKKADEKLRRSEARLRQVQADLAHVTRVTTIGELTASLAHEVNQPIAATVTNASAGLRWLAAQPPDMEEARQAFGRIVRDGNRAGQVIARIRALVKKSPPRKDWLDINETIREVVLLTGSEALKNRISLQNELSNDLPPILGDRIQLQQVILNLIKNAIEAMSGVSGRPRELLVSSGNDDSKGVLIAVRDSGPGLDPKARVHLFDHFYTTKPEGMGMGLAISRSIIEAHGGRLWATSNQPHGVVFQFTLPADADRMATNMEIADD